jgi:glycosyltransferase involved in cell wall biosynthesis
MNTPSAKTADNIGILLCTYNGAQWLIEQLNSINNQTLKPSLLYCIDDGSTDNTLEILHDFKNTSTIKTIIQQNPKNLGPSTNFLNGLKKINTEWVLFADQDDIWEPQKIELFQNEIKDDKLFYTSDCDLIFPQNRIGHKTFWQEINFDKIKIEKFKYDQLGVLALNPLFLGMCTMVHRNTALKFQEPPFELLHDEWLSWNFGIDNKIQLIEKSTAKYRQHPNQKTGVRKPYSIKNLLSILSKLRTQNGPIQELERIKKFRQFLELNKIETASDASIALQKHLETRCNFKIMSIPKWIYDWIKGDYHKFSAGTPSLIKDITGALFKCK